MVINGASSWSEASSPAFRTCVRAARYPDLHMASPSSGFFMGNKNVHLPTQSGIVGWLHGFRLRNLEFIHQG